MYKEVEDNNIFFLCKTPRIEQINDSYNRLKQSSNIHFSAVQKYIYRNIKFNLKLYYYLFNYSPWF